MNSLEPEFVKLYPKLYPIRHLLGFIGGFLLVTAIRMWGELPLRTTVLMTIAGLTLIAAMFLLKREYLKRRKLLGDL